MLKLRNAQESDATFHRLLNDVQAHGRFVEVQRPAHAENIGSEQPSVFSVPNALLGAFDSRNPELERYVVVPSVTLLGAIGVDGGGYRKYGNYGPPH